MSLIILLILQFYADSQTRTSQGLEQLFEQESILFINPRTFLIITTIWTVISSTKSYVSSSSSRDYFPFKSKLVLGLYVACSLITRETNIFHTLWTTAVLLKTAATDMQNLWQRFAYHLG